MIVRFNNQYLEDLFENKPVVGKPIYDKNIIRKYKKVVQILKYVDTSQQIYDFKGLHFEKLSGNLTGYYSCRVDKKFRLILSFEKDEILITEIAVVEDLNNHYY